MFIVLMIVVTGCLDVFTCIHAEHLVLQAPVEDRSEKLKFGQTTCVSRDGRRIAVGANGYDKFRGAMYIYELAGGKGNRMENWRRFRMCGNDTRRAQDKKRRELRVVERGSGFGFCCALSSDAGRIVVGAPGHELQRGAVYVFGNWEGRWEQMDVLKGPDGRSGDCFGWVVVMNEDCSRVGVSAKGRRANNGEVYIFDCGSGCMDCKLSSRISPPDYTDSAGPRGIRIRNNFGVSMGMNAKGDVLAVGCTGFKEERGAVYVFGRREEGAWELMQRLESPNGQRVGFFGFKLDMDGSGRRLAVGADGEDEEKGAVYMFEMEKDKFKMRQRMVAEERAVEDNFGGSVALSGNGRALVVGAPGARRDGFKDHGMLVVFEEMKGRKERWEVGEELWLEEEDSQTGNLFGWHVALSEDGKRFAATAPESNNGLGLAAFGALEVTGKWRADWKSLIDDDVPHIGAKEEL